MQLPMLNCGPRNSSRRGFTIVELLIVVVVIAILAAVTIVAFNGVVSRSQDSRRQDDAQAITKALQLYYIDNGSYPTSSGSTTINNFWSTTADASWANLQSQLSKYISTLPTDPANITGVSPLGASGRGYAYFANPTNYCGSAPGQMYILTYKLNGTQTDTLDGPCPTNGLYYAGQSNWRVVR